MKTKVEIPTLLPSILSFVSRTFFNECLKNSVRNCFSFALNQIIGKTIKTLCFHNNTDLLYQSWPTHTMH